MPAPKRDLETIHGRLQFARDRAGYTRAQFAERMKRSSDGWAKIELGTNSLSADVLAEANEILGLDERFYFGKISYDEAKSGQSQSLSGIAEDIRSIRDQVQGKTGDDADGIAQRIRANASLQELFEQVRFWDAGAIARFREWAAAFMAGGGGKAGAKPDQRQVRSTG